MPTTTKPKPSASKPRRSTRRRGPVELPLWGDHVQAIRAVALAASKDMARPVLVGLHCVGDGTTVSIEATDSYRLHRATLAIATDKFEAVVPAAWLVKALREVQPVAGGPSAVVFDAEFVRATVANDAESRSVALIVEDYPGTAGLLARYDAEHDSDRRIAVNPRYFADVLKACELFGGETAAARFKVIGQQWAPLRFDVHRGDDRFVGLLMPLRVDE